MEQDRLPCGESILPEGAACDRAVFERVWRRVMPEDRPDCPFLLDATDPAVQPAQAQGPCAAEAPGIQHSPVSQPAVIAPATSPCAAVPDTSLACVPVRVSDIPQSSHECACTELDNDVPCLGAASAIYGSQLQDFIDHELTDWRTYQVLSKRGQGNAGRVLSTIAADERRHAKRLSTAYFLISGVRYWPLDRIAPMPIGTYLGALRQRFCEEQRGEAAYLSAAAETSDSCLRELYLELAGDENSHAWLIRGILEQI